MVATIEGFHCNLNYLGKYTNLMEYFKEVGQHNYCTMKISLIIKLVRFGSKRFRFVRIHCKYKATPTVLIPFPLPLLTQEVHPNSPAAQAGLIPHTDYVVGSDSLVGTEDDFYSMIETNNQKQIKLYVYNSDSDSCREVSHQISSGTSGKNKVALQMLTVLLLMSFKGSMSPVPECPLICRFHINGNFQGFSDTGRICDKC